ncbi:MAG TPA: SGNH/GDSL hydrolase family protein [Actinospica sp.]|nr:SGNH/GDSL hydrolase family protein [Actinospica sp.]
MMPTLARRCASTVATVGTAAAVALAGSGAAHAASANYVALGDSYSSGVGAGSYTSSSGSCDRSTNAYSQLWTNAHSPSSFTFVACSGATTSDVLSGQVSSLSSATSLVSITIGGNDVGFSGVMETCVLDSTSSCVSAVDTAESEARNQLPAKLDSVYAAIKADAPNARVVVLDYPEFYDLSKSSSCIGLSTTDRTDLNQAADILDGVIQTEAAKYGDVFADVRSAFSGHEICDSSSWLHSVNFLDISESYHPTASGQSGAYYPVFNSNA